MWNGVQRKGLEQIRWLVRGAAAVMGLLLAMAANAQQLQEYARTRHALAEFIRKELAEKQIPGMAIALVDGQRIVWSAGFGKADPWGDAPMAATSVQRVGSVSKLFTDLAVMQMVEAGQVSLDQPVRTWLPDFMPNTPGAGEITLRQLMSHRAGLHREPPVGHYFDPGEPSLEESVLSLNKTTLVYTPGSRQKYSNAGIAVLGRVLEVVAKADFEGLLETRLLKPMGMVRSAFSLKPRLQPDLAKGMMWTLDGREFPAPLFQLGTLPAGSLYASAEDLARFLTMLHGEGEFQGVRVVGKESLREMLTPQFAEPGASNGFGLGFHLSRLDGKLLAGHGGAIYGFATQLSFLPSEKLGVVVVANKDFVNAITERVARLALQSMIAEREGARPPEFPTTLPPNKEWAGSLPGHYVAEGRDSFDLEARNGTLSLIWHRTGIPHLLRQQGGGLTADGALGVGLAVEPTEGGLKVGGALYRREADSPPPPAPERWRGLIGEYGWDHDVLYLLERGGKLWVLIEWFEYSPLEELSGGRFRFPSRGLYDAEIITPKWDARGRCVALDVGGMSFPRRAIEPTAGSNQLIVKPVRPVDELRREALRATPPEEKGPFSNAPLVNVDRLAKGFKLDVRYASSNNFLGTPFYTQAKVFLRQPVAEALVRANARLAERGYGILLHDGYRPWHVTKIFWEGMPANLREFVADPSKGSRHNRGAAIDCSLYDLKTGEDVEMVGTYDETTARSMPHYPGGTALQRWRRDLLRRAMEAEGFSVYHNEWWHFDHESWRGFGLGNETFEELDAKGH